MRERLFENHPSSATATRIFACRFVLWTSSRWHVGVFLNGVGSEHTARGFADAVAARGSISEARGRERPRHGIHLLPEGAAAVPAAGRMTVWRGTEAVRVLNERPSALNRDGIDRGEGVLPGMKWQVHGTRQAYGSSWVEVWLDDVELPGGEHVEHHRLEFPRPSNTAVVVDDRDRVLLIWRHRYITDTGGWEVPAGWSDPGEEPIEAIRREIEEETGYRPGVIRKMIAYDAIAGISTMQFTSFLATDAVCIGEPTDTSETGRVEWVPLAEVSNLTETGQMSDGPSLMALSYYLGVFRAAEKRRNPIEQEQGDR